MYWSRNIGLLTNLLFFVCGTIAAQQSYPVYIYFNKAELDIEGIPVKFNQPYLKMYSNTLDTTLVLEDDEKRTFSMIKKGELITFEFQEGDDIIKGNLTLYSDVLCRYVAPYDTDFYPIIQAEHYLLPLRSGTWTYCIKGKTWKKEYYFHYKKSTLPTQGERR